MNDLLATEKHSALENMNEKDWARGLGPVDDVWSFVNECGEGSWMGAFGATVSLGANTITAVFNPIQAATSWIVSWILDHIHPLPDWLQLLTGDPDEVEAGAHTWASIGERLELTGQALRASFATIEDEESATLDAYRERMNTIVGILDAQSAAAMQLAGTVQKLGRIVEVVYNLVREVIAEAIGVFVENATMALLSAGSALPLVVAKIAAWVGRVLPKVTGKIDEAIAAFEAAGKLARQLTEALRGLARFLQELMRVAGRPADLLNEAMAKAGRASGNMLANLRPVKSSVDFLADGVRKVKNALRPDGPSASGKVPIPESMTDRLIQNEGKVQLNSFLDEMGVSDPTELGLAKWVRSLSQAKRREFAENLSVPEARILLNRLTPEEQLDIFAAMPDAARRDELMEKVAYRGDDLPEGAGDVRVSEAIGGDFNEGVRFLEDAQQQLGDAAQAAQVAKALMDDERYDPPE